MVGYAQCAPLRFCGNGNCDVDDGGVGLFQPAAAAAALLLLAVELAPPALDDAADALVMPLPGAPVEFWLVAALLVVTEDDPLLAFVPPTLDPPWLEAPPAGTPLVEPPEHPYKQKYAVTAAGTV